MKTFRSFGIIPISSKGEVMLVCRKDTIGFMEFVKGNYTFDSKSAKYPHIVDLFNMMTKSELSFLSNTECSYKQASEKLYGKSQISKTHSFIQQKEKEKFDKYKTSWQKICNDILKRGGHWDEAEWGFPKGKKEKFETELDCALRELYEETGINREMITIDNEQKFIELRNEGEKEFIYEYYVGYLCEDFNIETVKKQEKEISKVGLFPINDCIKKIRHYFKNRIRILLELNNILGANSN